MKVVVIIICFLYCMCGCSRTYSKDDFKDSEWADSNGTNIILYDGGSCIVQNLDWHKIYPKEWMADSIWQKSHPSSFNGHWIIRPNERGGQELKIQVTNSNYGCSFNIKSVNTIEYTIGDPDDCSYYQFKRQ